MTWHFISLNDVVPTPWRNGGGTTRELVAWPDSTAWRWRASVAEVIESGPFSSFAGVQRWFAVLGGNGVRLTIAGCLHKLNKSDEPLMFDGASQTYCELPSGATQDFNLMVQDGVRAQMRRISGRCNVVANAPKIIAVYPGNQCATVQIGTEKHQLLPFSFGWALVQANLAVHVLASNALLMEIDP